MNAPPTPYERFMSRLRVDPAQQPRTENWPLYERLKADFQHACPGVTPQQYEAAMTAIAKATGV
jgi:hypothetical protein